MTSIPRTALLATAFVAAGLASPASTAAESYDSCTGFIESLPATISTQGVWCLRRNLATAMTSGNAITITVNNVTIDCNDFKIGGLAAGTPWTPATTLSTTSVSPAIPNASAAKVEPPVSNTRLRRTRWSSPSISIPMYRLPSSRLSSMRWPAPVR